MRILKMSETDSYNKYIIFDHMPRLKYEKINSDYMALIKDENGNIIAYDLLAYSNMSDAFAGRELKLSMVDGTTERVKNHWWSSSAEHNHYDKSILHDEKFVSVGCSTVTNLRKCFVDLQSDDAEQKEIIQEWMNHAIRIYNRKLCDGCLKSSNIYASNRKVKTEYNNSDTKRNSVSCRNP